MVVAQLPGHLICQLMYSCCGVMLCAHPIDVILILTFDSHLLDASRSAMQELARLSLPRIWHVHWEYSAMCSTALTRWTTRPWGRSTRVWPRLELGAVLMSSTASLWRCCLCAQRSIRYLMITTPAASLNDVHSQAVHHDTRASLKTGQTQSSPVTVLRIMCS